MSRSTGLGWYKVQDDLACIQGRDRFIGHDLGVEADHTLGSPFQYPQRDVSLTGLVWNPRWLRRVGMQTVCKHLCIVWLTLNASNLKELNDFYLYSSFILSWPHIHLDGDELNQWNENKLTPQTNLHIEAPNNNFTSEERATITKEEPGFRLQTAQRAFAKPADVARSSLHQSSVASTVGRLVVSVSMQPKVLPHGWRKKQLMWESPPQ